jgi:plastocyanin
MNAIVWSSCKKPYPCTIVQADDIRGAIRRYGGHVRARGVNFCPPPPSKPSITPLTTDYGMTATFRMPKLPWVAGYRYEVGRDCVAKPTRNAGGSVGRPGETVNADIAVPGDPATAAGDYCLSVWSEGDIDRVGSKPVQVRFTYRPEPLPPPGELTATQQEGQVQLSWREPRHDQVAGYVMAAARGASCATAPPPDARKVETTYGSLDSPGRGPACFAVWSQDRYGHVSPSAATVVVTLKGSTAPTAAITPEYSSVAPGQAVQFTDASTDDGTIVSRSWDFGDGSTSAEASPSHAYVDPGQYAVVLTVTDDDGYQSQAYAYVDVAEPAP